jgi:AcrR family transcriptional regulator
VNDSLTYSPKRKDKEARVMEAALDVFSEFGFRKASIEDIANKLNLTPAALYRYAGDKKDLYKKAVRHGFGLWQEYVIHAAENETDPVSRFTTTCRTAFAYLAKEPRLKKILASDPSLFPIFEADDPFLEINEASIGLLEKIILDGYEQGVFAAKSEPAADARAVARVIFSLYILFIQKEYVAGETGEASLFERGLDLVLDGLRSR